MRTPDRKVRKLMEEYQKSGNLSKVALRVDLDGKTVRKYLSCGLRRDAVATICGSRRGDADIAKVAEPSRLWLRLGGPARRGLMMTKRVDHAMAR